MLLRDAMCLDFYPGPDQWEPQYVSSIAWHSDSRGREFVGAQLFTEEQKHIHVGTYVRDHRDNVYQVIRKSMKFSSGATIAVRRVELTTDFPARYVNAS